MIINVKNLWKTYGHGDTAVHAVRGIDLNVKEGEFIALMGPSGSGKSSLLHLIGAMDSPTDGEIIFKGKNYSKLNPKQKTDLRLRRIGFIFQTFNLIPSLSAIENVALPMKLAGISRKEANEKAKQLLGKVNLLDRLEHMPSKLSGGQRQRVAIARALANHPDLILADEPTGNLDSENGKIIIDLLEKLHSDGHTILIVTHDPELSERVSRVVYIRDGQLNDYQPVEQ
ncbi:ABC transporter ATP-binding protein [Pseudalkalibacillus sp. A8]|uniref:ABC transporter ATP-binding protein n=1 Tax=Pseudalkalibacillus sp. A8 TaxID=3382641 RepID=UPI0038B544D2